MNLVTPGFVVLVVVVRISVGSCAGPLIVGTLSYLVPDIFGHPSVWSYFGGLGPDGYIGYLFVPLVLPFLGLWWLWSHRPARVASLDDVAAVS